MWVLDLSHFNIKGSFGSLNYHGKRGDVVRELLETKFTPPLGLWDSPALCGAVL